MGLIAAGRAAGPSHRQPPPRTQLDPGNASFSRNYAETLLGCRRYDD